MTLNAGQEDTPPMMQLGNACIHVVQLQTAEKVRLGVKGFVT